MNNEEQEIKKAVALSYNVQVDQAPRIIATGRGQAAKNIVDLAKEYGIVVHQDQQLIEQLMQLQFNQEIPPQFYSVIAEIFSFVYELENGLMQRKA